MGAEIGDLDVDGEEMVKKLGVKGVAEAFVKGESLLQEAWEQVPESERPQPMTAREWIALADQEDSEEEGEDLEEEDEDEDEEEDEDELDEAVDLGDEDEAAAPYAPGEDGGEGGAQ